MEARSIHFCLLCGHIMGAREHLSASGYHVSCFGRWEKKRMRWNVLQLGSHGNHEEGVVSRVTRGSSLGHRGVLTLRNGEKCQQRDIFIVKIFYKFVILLLTFFLFFGCAAPLVGSLFVEGTESVSLCSGITES